MRPTAMQPTAGFTAEPVSTRLQKGKDALVVTRMVVPVISECAVMKGNWTDAGCVKISPAPTDSFLTRPGKVCALAAARLSERSARKITQDW